MRSRRGPSGRGTSAAPAPPAARCGCPAAPRPEPLRGTSATCGNFSPSPSAQLTGPGAWWWGEKRGRPQQVRTPRRRGGPRALTRRTPLRLAHLRGRARCGGERRPPLLQEAGRGGGGGAVYTGHPRPRGRGGDAGGGGAVRCGARARRSGDGAALPLRSRAGPTPGSPPPCAKWCW